MKKKLINLRAASKKISKIMSYGDLVVLLRHADRITKVFSPVDGYNRVPINFINEKSLVPFLYFSFPSGTPGDPPREHRFPITPKCIPYRTSSGVAIRDEKGKTLFEFEVQQFAKPNCPF